MNGAFETLPEIPRSLLESGLSPEGRNFNSLADLGSLAARKDLLR
jgi:hypothetical protein